MKQLTLIWRHKYTQVLWLPLALILLSIVQTYIFNAWVGINNPHPVRLFSSSLAISTLIFGLGLVFPANKQRWYLAAASILTSLIFITQFLYFSYYSSFLQASALKYASQAGAVSDTIATLISPALAVFLLGPILVLLASVLRKYTPPILSLRQQLMALGAVLAVFAAGHGYLVYKEYKRWGTPCRLYCRAFDNSDVVRKLGIINFTGLDFVRQAFKQKGVSEAEKQFALSYAAQAKSKPIQNGPNFTGVAKGRNVIFLQLESVEGWVLNKAIEGQEITPNLNKLAKEGLNFTEYYHHVGPGTTADAEFQTLTGMYAPMTEVPFFEYPTHDYNALPEYLKRYGYKQGAVFHGDEKTFWNRTAIYPQLGIDTFTGVEAYNVPRKVIWGLSDYDFFEQSVAKMGKLKSPFFLNLMALTSHTPFDLPRDLVRIKVDNTKLGISDFQAHYIEAVNYVDYAVGQLMEQLKQNGLYDNTLFVIYGDHKAQIAPRHDSNFARFEGAGDYYSDFTYLKHLRGPMIILAPGTAARGSIDTPATHVDLYPTLTNLLGIPTPASVFGADMLNNPQAYAINRRTTGAIDSIIGREVVYFASDDGEYTRGRCLELPSLRSVELKRCQPYYDSAAIKAKASDIFLRGNLIPELVK